MTRYMLRNYHYYTYKFGSEIFGKVSDTRL
jgi:hypothetical protein